MKTTSEHGDGVTVRYEINEEKRMKESKNVSKILVNLF
jgi:hypothetical protein